MGRKRVTQIFPWLLPARERQKKFFFYTGMKLDKNIYAKKITEEILANVLCEREHDLYNLETGMDIRYQENKVFNLRLMKKQLDGLVIFPGETFSFWNATKDSDKEVPYKEGLVVVNGKLEVANGGGLCQMSNLLFELFLHTPLTVKERTGHRVKGFPNNQETLLGMDATVAEGWIDLKVKNDTDTKFQIKIQLKEDKIKGQILTSRDLKQSFEITNGTPVYYDKKGKTFEEVEVIRSTFSEPSKKCIEKKVLYKNLTEIAYEIGSGRKKEGDVI